MSGLTLNSVCVRHAGAQSSAVRDVSLHAPPGAVLGLVGESGCGKSTLARAISGLIPLASGNVELDGRAVGRSRGASPVQMVFQNPQASLNPRLSIGASVREAVDARGIRGAEARAAVQEALSSVGLPPALAGRRPGELSGGQRQRVAIARALAAHPQVIVADEITSALDVSVQAAILNLIAELQRERGFILIFISHNLAAVRYLAHEIAVMRSGEIVEHGDADQVTRAPRCAYTRDLINATPSLRTSPRTGFDR